MYGNMLNGSTPYAHIVIGDTDITPGSIAVDPGVSIVQTLCSDEGYAIGGFGSAQLTFSVVTDALPASVVDKPIRVYMGYADSEEEITVSNVIPVGEFFTTEDKMVTKGLFTTITAYDASYYADGLYLPTGGIMPGTVNNVINDVCSQSGLTLASDAYSQITMPVSSGVYEDLTGLTYRDVIAHCALLLGANACIDRYGKLTFKIPGRTPVAAFGPSSYMYSDYTLQSNAIYTMARLIVNYNHEITTGEGEEQETEEVTDTFVYQASGSTSQKGIQIDTGGIRTQADTNTLGSALFGTSGFSFYGYSLGVDGRPEFDLGDAFTLTDDADITRTFYVLAHTITFNGTLTSEFSASVPADNITSLDTMQRATLSEQVQQLTGLSAKMNRIVTDLIESTDARFANVVAKVLNADELNAKVANITQAKIENLDANSINGKAIKNSAVLAKALSNELIETVLGVKVFYQPDAPTATQVGDIWYKTLTDIYDPQSDPIYQWDGNAWTMIEDGVQSIFMANSIIAQDINTNSLASNNAFIDLLETNMARIGDMAGRHVTVDETGFHIYNGISKIADMSYNGIKFWNQSDEIFDLKVNSGPVSVIKTLPGRYIKNTDFVDPIIWSVDTRLEPTGDFSTVDVMRVYIPEFSSEPYELSEWNPEIILYDPSVGRNVGSIIYYHGDGHTIRIYVSYDAPVGDPPFTDGFNVEKVEIGWTTNYEPISRLSLGKYPKIDPDKILEIGGGFDDSNRQNAFDVDVVGNGRFLGSVFAGGVMLADINHNHDGRYPRYTKGTTTAGSVTWKYKKYADGELEMWGSAITTLAIATPSGGIYTTANEYAVAIPAFVDTVDFATGELSGGGWVDFTAVTNPTIRLYAPTSYSSTNRTLKYYVRGTWK